MRGFDSIVEDCRKNDLRQVAQSEKYTTILFLNRDDPIGYIRQMIYGAGSSDDPTATKSEKMRQGPTKRFYEI